MWSCDFLGKSRSRSNYHPASFCGDRHCGGGDIMILVCHLISQYHVIMWSCDFMGKSSSR